MTVKSEETIELKALCAELKIDPRDARAKLRLAVKDAKKYPEISKAYKSRQPWQWVKDSPAHKEAQKALIS
mgnify:CR=1 FL=1